VKGKERRRAKRRRVRVNYKSFGRVAKKWGASEKGGRTSCVDGIDDGMENVREREKEMGGWWMVDGGCDRELWGFGDARLLACPCPWHPCCWLDATPPPYLAFDLASV
jgi:hypothetical protein